MPLFCLIVLYWHVCICYNTRGMSCLQIIAQDSVPGDNSGIRDKKDF